RLVRESRIIEPKRLDDYLERLGPAALPQRAEELADQLLQDGLLTTFQAEQLLLGKWHGLMIGRYKVLDRLDKRSDGSVYLAVQPSVVRRVAIKVLALSGSPGPGLVQRFQREARALAALDHPNIVRVHDFDQDGRQLFLVLEYVNGVSLRQLVTRHGP